MKYWGRGILMYLTITVLLYGTQDIWSDRSYNASVADPITIDQQKRLGGTPGNR